MGNFNAITGSPIAVAQFQGSTSEADFARSLLSGRLGKSAVQRRLFDAELPKTLSLVVNNSCNFSCRHCYLNVPRLNAASLKLEEWHYLLDKIVSNAPRQVVVAGKEVLHTELGIEIANAIGSRLKESSAQAGIITNGSLANSFEAYSLLDLYDFIDVSLDGPKSINDKVRGPGTYQLVTNALKSFPRKLIEKTSITFTINNKNYHCLPDMLSFVSQLGIPALGSSFIEMFSTPKMTSI